MRRECAMVAALATAPILCAAAAGVSAKVITTKDQKVGNGSAHTYVAIDAAGRLVGIVVSLDKRALDGLPHAPNATSRCFDRNANGKIDSDECVGDYNFTFEIPREATKAAAPFKWVALNWNPHGHGSPAPPAWSAPHFDFHFYIVPRQVVKELRPGSCGEFIDCDDFKRATRPVPATFVHPDHIDVGAAVPDMGNHLIDSRSPELAKNGPAFTHTFIFGADDGHITFLEPMITRAYIASNPDMCAPIKQPQAWEAAGSYPTRYCIRYLERSGRYTISLEGFVNQPS
jgi:hypothetical protein